MKAKDTREAVIFMRTFKERWRAVQKWEETTRYKQVINRVGSYPEISKFFWVFLSSALSQSAGWDPLSEGPQGKTEGIKRPSHSFWLALGL